MRAVAIGLGLLATGLSGAFTAQRIAETYSSSPVQLISAKAAREATISKDPAALAAALLTPHPSQGTVVAARTALRDDPLNPGLLRLLAFAQPLGDKDANFAVLTGLSNEVSRRDGVLQLWRVIDTIRQGDAERMMGHVDILLRTHPETAPVVFGALSQSLTTPTFRASFARSLAKQPPWLADFVIGAVNKTDRPDLLAQALGQFKTLPRSVDLDSAWYQLMQKLADAGKTAELRSIYVRLPQARPAMLTSVELPRSEDDALLAPVAWQLIQNGEISVDLVAGTGNSRALEFSVSGGRSGLAARKAVLLKPGRYTFGFATRPGEGAPRLEVAVRCMDDGSILARSDFVPVVAGRRTIVFTAAGSCPAVIVEVNVRGDQSGIASSFSANAFTLSSGAASEPAK